MKLLVSGAKCANAEKHIRNVKMHLYLTPPPPPKKKKKEKKNGISWLG